MRLTDRNKRIEAEAKSRAEMKNTVKDYKALFSEAAKSIMCSTDEIHDVMDSMMVDILNTKESKEDLVKHIKVVRRKLRVINNINLSKLYGVPYSVLTFEGEV